MKYGRTAGIGCGVVLGLGLASGASAQVTPVVAGDSITAAGINAIIAAVNSVGALQGNLDLPDTTPITGQVRVNGTRFLHSFGTNNTFLGENAGSFFSAGRFENSDNTAVGSTALEKNTEGSQNTAVGNEALAANTTGFHNTGVGKTRSVPTLTGLRTRRSAKRRSLPTSTGVTTRRSAPTRSVATPRASTTRRSAKTRSKLAPGVGTRRSAKTRSFPTPRATTTWRSGKTRVSMPPR